MSNVKKYPGNRGCLKKAQNLVCHRLCENNCISNPEGQCNLKAGLRRGAERPSARIPPCWGDTCCFHEQVKRPGRQPDVGPSRPSVPLWARVAVLARRSKSKSTLILTTLISLAFIVHVFYFIISKGSLSNVFSVSQSPSLSILGKGRPRDRSHHRVKQEEQRSGLKINK